VFAKVWIQEKTSDTMLTRWHTQE